MTLHVPFVIRGETRTGGDVTHRTRVGEDFAVPRLDLDELVVARSAGGPAFDVPLAEIIDFLGATAKQLDFATNTHLREAAGLMSQVSTHSARVIENGYRALPLLFEPGALRFQVERELGADALDSWVPVHRNGVPLSRIRAFPPRLVHIMAGNAPVAAAVSIVRGALTKGINLLKLPSNDLYTATAILRTMADVDPDHPCLRSFSAVYWRGGDTEVERLLFRPQYFDKLVAWGGEATIRHAIGYIGPGFELVAFDPKVSTSMIGREAFADDDTLRRVAELAAEDATVMNQDACAASRHQFVECDDVDAERYCELLAREMAVERPWADARIGRTPPEIREEVEALRDLDGYGVHGDYDGHGLVVRSPEPVDFHPIGKTINVIPVADLAEATAYATVATQTVGVYPPERKVELRDALAAHGVQRVVSLGGAFGLANGGHGLPHDGSFPLQRLVRWVSDEDG